jgi:uncharacterized protein YdcH (DUF465 family)
MEDARYTELKDQLNKLEERVRSVEKEQAGTIIYIKEIKEDLKEIKSELKKISPSDITPKTGFWQSDSGKFIIRTLCIMGVLIVMAAIGMNYFKEYLGVIGK